ncbi:DEAD/DEAH box helicase [Corynebacterium sp. H78]|uniref:DEAD/DEAH box helicase n=1 Tax=Corynebacterium sp. H78 TaxID=3133417 RepID=UPI0030AA37C6
MASGPIASGATDRDVVSLRHDLNFGFVDHAVESPRIYEPQLIANTPDVSMLGALHEELKRSDSFKFSIAFVSATGLALLKQALLDFKGRGTIVTSRYLDFNHPDVFRELLLLDNVDVYIYDNPRAGFHAKGYVFEQTPLLTAIIGSSNLTDSALVSNQEWNFRFSASTDGDIAYQLSAAIDRQLADSFPLTAEWILEYERVRKPRVAVQTVSDEGFDLDADARIEPNAMQADALEKIDELRLAGERRAVVVSATGTGKTILAALAVRNANPARMLFIVHREQILDKAIEEFRRVLERPRSDFGKFVGASRELDTPFVFASIQSLSRAETLGQIPSDAFDYIIVDEVHRSGATSYRRVIDHFSPEFLLGLTATPERTDGFNVYELFDYNVPYEIRLHAALEEEMLVPFHYYGVTDFVNENNETVTDTSELAYLVNEERVKHILEKLRQYGHPRGARGLIFCSRKTEARELSVLLNREKLNGLRLRTAALTGESDIRERNATVAKLEAGELDYIVTVDLFNEGIDIPTINQIVMLRGTQSSIIFTQQLGRGLRKAPGKDHLRVIDFIGNYANNYLIPIALFGDNSRDKDRIRKSIIESSHRALSGVSSVNFDEISQAKILQSLAVARISGKQEFKKDILNLQERLNAIPRLMDFARFQTVDPVVLSTKYENYWSLLHSLKFVESAPGAVEKPILDFMSKELLNGKRPHELLVLRELLKKGKLSREDVRELFITQRTRADASIVESVVRVLHFDFHTGPQVAKYGGIPLIEVDGNSIVLAPELAEAYGVGAGVAGASVDGHGFPDTFRSHVDDLIECGLFQSKHVTSWEGELVVGNRYSRRDVCRLLGWENNNESTVYGYKVERKTKSCPIFVTYHKSRDVEASVAYQDRFLSPQVMQWFTRSRRTLKSQEVRDILGNAIDLHLFVKKDDAEGTDFFYMGKARSSDAVQEKMPGDDGKQLDVVRMHLNLDVPVPSSLFEYLESKLEV